MITENVVSSMVVKVQWLVVSPRGISKMRATSPLQAPSMLLSPASSVPPLDVCARAHSRSLRGVGVAVAVFVGVLVGVFVGVLVAVLVGVSFI